MACNKTFMNNPSLVINKNCHQDIVTTDSLVIAPDFTWSIYVGSNLIDPQQCQLLRTVSIKLKGVDVVVKLFLSLDQSSFCFGNSDEKFTGINNCHKGCFISKAGK